MAIDRSCRVRACSSRMSALLTARSRLARDRKSTRLNSSHQIISYAVFCLKKNDVTVWRGTQAGGDSEENGDEDEEEGGVGGRHTAMRGRSPVPRQRVALCALAARPVAVAR